MYGLGNIWRRGVRNDRSNGSFQLAAAFEIVSKLKERYPGITMTSQEPCHVPAEIEYLQNHDVYVSRSRFFSPNHFLDAKIKSGVPHPMMVVYMPYFPHFEQFLYAYWDPLLLSQIIFIGNSTMNCNNPAIANNEKSKAYFKFCKSKTLPCEEFTIDYEQEIFPWEWPPFCGKASDFVTWRCFDALEVYTISYEDAEKLVQTFPKHCIKSFNV